MECGGEDELAFPPQNGCFFGSGDTFWDFQLGSVGPGCLCSASLAGSYDSAAGPLLSFP